MEQKKSHMAMSGECGGYSKAKVVWLVDLCASGFILIKKHGPSTYQFFPNTVQEGLCKSAYNIPGY